MRQLAPVRDSDRLDVATNQIRATTPRPPPPRQLRPPATASPLSVGRPFASAWNESSDTAVLPFASQINCIPPAKANNCSFKMEVIFCVQGAISPLLANIYLHYVFDLWAERWRRHEATGGMMIVRYADDIVVGFAHEIDAWRFWDAMRKRFEEFALSLPPEKTRLIEFGRQAANRRDQRGLGKPETFNFLGFCCELADRYVFDHAPTQRAAGLLGHGDAPALSEVVKTPRSQDRTHPSATL